MDLKGHPLAMITVTCTSRHRRTGTRVAWLECTECGQSFSASVELPMIMKAAEVHARAAHAAVFSQNGGCRTPAAMFFSPPEPIPSDSHGAVTDRDDPR